MTEEDVGTRVEELRAQHEYLVAQWSLTTQPESRLRILEQLQSVIARLQALGDDHYASIRGRARLRYNKESE
jgi:hypothetical protein